MDKPSGRLGERKRNSTTPASSLLKVGRHSAWATDDPIDKSELPRGFTSTEGFVRLGEIAKVEKGSTAIQRAKLRIPLPPLAEQHRIVAKVGELMALCDQLEASLTAAQTETSRLLESVLHHALQNPALA